MDNPQINLDPVVRQVAAYYGFTINFDEELNKWIIKDPNQSFSIGFYWCSLYTVDVFFDNLRDYFEDCGARRDQ